MKDKVLTASTLLHRLVLLIACLINPMSVRYSTNWDRKGWPGSTTTARDHDMINLEGGQFQICITELQR